MKFSLAVFLGASTCKMVASDINSCAIGSALNAMGVATGIEANDRYAAATCIWPWLHDSLPYPLHLTFCNYPSLMERMAALTYMQLVWQYFDDHVCEGRMTLEELTDLIAIMEPDCDCNQFNCNCEKETFPLDTAHETDKIALAQG